MNCTICGKDMPPGAGGQTCSYPCRARLRESRKTVEWRRPREYPVEVVEAVRRMYLDDEMTIREIQGRLPKGYKAQRIVARYVPMRRPATKRDQRGEKNSSWKGDDLGYAAAHWRVASERGTADAYQCVDCHRTARDWSYIGGCSREVRRPGVPPYSPNADRYVPRCRECHWAYDFKGRRPNGQFVSRGEVMSDV